ncbi:complex I intermediate-associated protein 30-domain-containing protein [Pavlovales sp. CCMP2436]|nr:complex I intermediate-associated protein 30-domain-containing protein [Pavlovales sp. CCMP2436]|mmetsp:Transcript_43540/g.102157  ORF Transcript_43540/g.102157 Transcript_43540/m.102157 type:complete len:347 (-) Transcript_43540:131-1171(-)
MWATVCIQHRITCESHAEAARGHLTLRSMTPRALHSSMLLAFLLATTVASCTMPRFSAVGRRLVDSPIFVLRGAQRAESLEFFERVDDQIMGGISQSVIIPSPLGDDCASFCGIVRTDGGGFCGTRTRLFTAPLNLGLYSGLYLKVRGDGKRYKINVRTTESVGELVYQAAILPPAEMCMVRVPFTAFRLVKRSEPVIDGPPLDAKSIYQLGLVLSRFAYGEGSTNDAFAAGPFRLDVAEIGAYRDECDFEASLDAGDSYVMADPGPALSSALTLWPEGKAPMTRGRVGLKNRVLRFVFRRFFKKKLAKRVATRRSARAVTLLGLRKQGKKLSQIRWMETQPKGAE